MSIFDPKTNIEQLKIVQENIDYHTVPEVMPEFPRSVEAYEIYKFQTRLSRTDEKKQ